MDPELGSSKAESNVKWLGKDGYMTVLILAYQSFGVVYGELSTSPLYVFKSTFDRKLAREHRNEDTVFGILSFIFWTLTLIPILKYMLIVMNAGDNGEGGVFALYSLLCRHAKLSLLPNQQVIDEELSAYRFEELDQACQDLTLKRRFCEGHNIVPKVLLIVVLLGTSMVIGNGVLIPSIKVLSSLSGLQVVFPEFCDGCVAIVACIILIGLFSLQHFGTHTISFLFAPVISTWLLCIGSIGIYNIFYWNPTVLKAFSPYYLFKHFQHTGIEGWISLGGIFLCITGAESMFLNLGHFTQTSIQIAFAAAVYPSLILAFTGQAAFLSKHMDDFEPSFFKCVPEAAFWPVLIVGTLASIVGSQAVLSAAFSLIKQCYSVGFFPRVKIVHTSDHLSGQIYIPDINWILMILCIFVTVGLNDTTSIGNAYGVAAIISMLVTTLLVSLVIVIVWKKSTILAACFLLAFGSIEGVYLSASLYKFLEGGWMPLAVALIFMVIMYVWHYGNLMKYQFDLDNRVSINWILGLGPSLGIARVPGIGLIYTELVTGIPPIFSHFMTNLPALHQVLVFLMVKSVPVPYISPAERFLIRRIGPKMHCMYRCIVRYGYKDIRQDNNKFEDQLFLNIAEFMQNEANQPCNSSDLEGAVDGQIIVLAGTGMAGRSVALHGDCNRLHSLSIPSSKPLTLESLESAPEIDCFQAKKKKVRFQLLQNPDTDPELKQQLIELIAAKEAGVVYIVGHSYVKAKKGSSFLKRVAINGIYSLLKINCRSIAVDLCIPCISLIELGMVYWI